MKSCHKHKASRRAVPQAVQKIPVHRYSHPISSAAPASEGSTEQVLSGILESLSRQSQLLEELLRRLDGVDTK